MSSRAIWTVSIVAFLVTAMSGLLMFKKLQGEDRWYTLTSATGERIFNTTVLIRRVGETEPAFFAESFTGAQIPNRFLRDGYEWFVGSPGFGLLHGPVDSDGDAWNSFLRFQSEFDLPDPIRLTIKIPGHFDLPEGDDGFMLRFIAIGVDDHVAKVLSRSPVAAAYWSWPEKARGSFNSPIWVSPKTREVAVLLPCIGEWRVQWSVLTRTKDGQAWDSDSISMVLAKGSAQIVVAANGETHSLPIRADELDEMEETE